MVLATVVRHKNFLSAVYFRFVVFAVDATLRRMPRTAGPLEWA